MEAEILSKEKLSVKGPFFHINNLEPSFDTENNVYRLFRMNRLMNHLHLQHAVPYMFKSFSPIQGFSYDDLRNKYTKLEDRPGQYFKLRLDSQKNSSSDN